MTAATDDIVTFVVAVTPHFNLAATAAFIDPLRAANYLGGRPRFRWSLASLDGGAVEASNGMVVETAPLRQMVQRPSYAVVSSSWTPEAHAHPTLLGALRRWARQGSRVVGVDTGAFILASAGLLDGRRATVHYEHFDAFEELVSTAQPCTDLYVIDGPCLTCCGGGASSDLALQIVVSHCGEALANSSARYLFHERLRPPGAQQNPSLVEPLGGASPDALRRAIEIMERNLEEPLAIPAIAAAVEVSQRQLERLFKRYVRKSPQLYYRDIRLDRARGFVTQTSLPLREVALACGFTSQVHFSRAYRDRFGMPPSADRIEGRVPFEFRAWPMHRKGGDDGDA